MCLLWLALWRGEERRGAGWGGGQEGRTEDPARDMPGADMIDADKSTTSSLTLLCPLKTSRSLIGNEVN